MRTVTTKLYTFSELDEVGQAEVIDRGRSILVYDDWAESTICDFKENVAPLFGLACSNVYFSGFSCQGDGACFTGAFEYVKGMAKKVKAFCPTDRELIRIADNLQYTQRKAFYRLHGSVSHRGRYYHSRNYHSGCTEFEVLLGDDDAPGIETDAIKALYRELMNWLYGQLEQEHDYFTSDAALREHFLECSDAEFTENGHRYE